VVHLLLRESDARVHFRITCVSKLAREYTSSKSIRHIISPVLCTQDLVGRRHTALSTLVIYVLTTVVKTCVYELYLRLTTSSLDR
jgi:hypothetical protein